MMDDTLREAIEREARSFVGVRVKARGRSRASGLDCISLVLEVIRVTGMIGPDHPKRWYPREVYENPAPHIEEFATLKPVSLATRGDLLVFKYGRFGTHFGIATESRGRLAVVHANDQIGKVVEHHVAGEWLRRLSRCYEFKGRA